MMADIATSPRPVCQDPMEEIYAIRREISEQYGHDVHLVFEAMRKEQDELEAKGVKFVRLPIARHRIVSETTGN